MIPPSLPVPRPTIVVTSIAAPNAILQEIARGAVEAAFDFVRGRSFAGSAGFPCL